MMTAKPDKTEPCNSPLVGGTLKSRPANPLPFGLGVLCCLIVHPWACAHVVDGLSMRLLSRPLGGYRRKRGALDGVSWV